MSDHHRTPTWYRDAIFYGIDVARFKDQDGNGFGDFKGLTAHLDYLSWLGVDAIWLLPFYKSPRRDNGYDIIDHYEIDPRIGTHGDFVALLREAEHRGIRVVIDLVINHTSDEHRWFRASCEDPSSPQRDWYVWTDDLDAVPDYRPVFPPEQTTTWTRQEARGAWYLHHFHDFEPDLNTNHPDLRAETRNMVEYWIRLGVRGFRVDGAPFLGQKRHRDENTAHELLHQIHAWADDIEEETILIPEADLPAQQLAPYAGNGDAQMLFNFIGCAQIFLALATQRAEALVPALEAPPAGAPGFTWLNFLRNHDELTLERLTREEMEQVLDVLAPDPGMRIFGRGTRRRLAPMLDGDRRRIELAFSLLFALPGAPLILAGDEIGMGENLDLPDRDAARLPIQWSADEPNGGFSRADPDDLVTPVLTDGPFGIGRVNVADQRADEDSLLHWMRRLIALRKHANRWLTTANPQIQIPAPTVFALTYPGADGRALVTVHNLGAEPVCLSFDIGARHAVALLTGPSMLADDGTSLDLAPYGYAWWEQRGVPQLSLAPTSLAAAPASADGDPA